MYAIIEACGRQYKVQEGEVVFFEKLDTEEGKNVTFDKIHCSGSNGGGLMARFINGATLENVNFICDTEDTKWTGTNANDLSTLFVNGGAGGRSGFINQSTFKNVTITNLSENADLHTIINPSNYVCGSILGGNTGKSDLAPFAFTMPIFDNCVINIADADYVIGYKAFDFSTGTFDPANKITEAPTGLSVNVQ